MEKEWHVEQINKAKAGMDAPFTIRDFSLSVLRSASFLQANAEEYKLNSNKIAVWDGSAGAHMAALATSYKAQKLEDLSFFGQSNKQRLRVGSG